MQPTWVAGLETCFRLPFLNSETAQNFLKITQQPEKHFGPFSPFPKLEMVWKRRNGTFKLFPCFTNYHLQNTSLSCKISTTVFLERKNSHFVKPN